MGNVKHDPVPLRNVRVMPRREVEQRPRYQMPDYAGYKWVDIPEPAKEAPVQPYTPPAPPVPVRPGPLARLGRWIWPQRPWYIHALRVFVGAGFGALGALVGYLVYDAIMFAIEVAHWLAKYWPVAVIVAVLVVIAVAKSGGKPLEVIAHACSKCLRPF